MRRSFTIIISGLLFLLGVTAACVPTGELKTESMNIERGGAETAAVEIEMGAGELTLEGGASLLAEGTFSYNVRRWKPVINYRVLGTKGKLSIGQRRSSGIPIGHAENTWEIRLNDEIPLDLEIDLGAGQSQLDLSRLDVRSLNIDMGVGELKLDLSGERKQNLEVKIDGGIGHGTIYLPETIGVRVKVEGGIGSVDSHSLAKTGDYYTNEAYGKTDVTLDIQVEAGIGSIDLRLK